LERENALGLSIVRQDEQKKMFKNRWGGLEPSAARKLIQGKLQEERSEEKAHGEGAWGGDV